MLDAISNGAVVLVSPFRKKKYKTTTPSKERRPSTRLAERTDFPAPGSISSVAVGSAGMFSLDRNRTWYSHNPQILRSHCVDPFLVIFLHQNPVASSWQAVVSIDIVQCVWICGVKPVQRLFLYPSAHRSIDRSKNG
jgi:hypothetical protein